MTSLLTFFMTISNCGSISRVARIVLEVLT